MVVALTYEDFGKMLQRCTINIDPIFTAEQQVVKKVVLISDALPRASIIFELSNGPSPTAFKELYPQAIKVNAIT